MSTDSWEADIMPTVVWVTIVMPDGSRRRAVDQAATSAAWEQARDEVAALRACALCGEASPASLRPAGDGELMLPRSLCLPGWRDFAPTGLLVCKDVGSCRDRINQESHDEHNRSRIAVNRP